VGGGVAVGVAVGVGVGLAMTDHHLMSEESCRYRQLRSLSTVTREGNIINVGTGSTGLVTPSKSGIGCVQDSSGPADGKATGWLWKVNGFNGLIVE